MPKFFFGKLNISAFVLFLFLLTYQNKVSATRVDASNFGFNAVDATAALQGAIDSKADTVLVPYMGKDWIVTPIVMTGSLNSNKVVIFNSPCAEYS
jgi:hypothetical protein